MNREQYDTLPNAIIVRELRYKISRRGFRPKSITLVTTLTDPEKYTAQVLADLYLGRWQIEVDLRHMKTTMHMEVLHCKSVDGVMKELWMYMLVYNLIRQVVMEASGLQGVEPERISFIDALRWLYSASQGQILIALIINPYRIDRVEPRVIKRRMKPFGLMNKPRAVLRQALINDQITG